MRSFSRLRGIAGQRIAAIFLAAMIAGFAAPHDVFAQWSPAGRREFARLERAVERIRNDEVGGIRGSAAVMLGGLVRSLFFRELPYRDERNFAPDGRSIELLISRTAREVSPLVVFFPGIFGDPRSGGSLMVGRQARRARNHVLILPNPWGSAFQAARPRFMPGDFDREAEAMVDMVEAGIRRIGAARISSIHFVGESYGGFLAPAAARYAIAGERFRVESVLSVSVPYHIGNAIEVMDGMADEQEANYFDNGCALATGDFFRMVGFLFEILSNPRARELYSGKGRTGCSKAVFAYAAFQQPLFELAKRLQDRRPSAEWAARPESEWRRKLRFRDFGRVFFGRDVREIVSRDSATLSYWIESLRASGVRTLGLVAKNDPLNPPPGVGSWDVIDAYPPEDVLVLERGGHLGFRGEKAYRKLLRHQLRDPGGPLAEGSDAEETPGFDEDLDDDPGSADDGIES